MSMIDWPHGARGWFGGGSRRGQRGAIQYTFHCRRRTPTAGGAKLYARSRNCSPAEIRDAHRTERSGARPPFWSWWIDACPVFGHAPDMSFPITEHTLKTARHTTGYLACGRQDGPLVVFVHGWPELSLSWRHQLPVLAALASLHRAGHAWYGHSTGLFPPMKTTPPTLDRGHDSNFSTLSLERAVWIGHDWGSQVVWSIAVTIPTAASASAPVRPLHS